MHDGNGGARPRSTLRATSLFIITDPAVTTTMIPILGEFIFGTNPAVPNWPSVGVYCPWLFIPLAITLRMALADYGSSSSSGSKGGRSKRSKAA